MSILDTMTQAEKTAYRQKKLKEIQDYNADLINDLGIDKKDFNMKKAFTRNGVIVVGMFDSEFKKEKGYYFELIDSNLEPEDTDNRTVYRLAPSPSDFYTEEYEMDEFGKFLVPVEELRVVNRQSVAISKSSAVTSSDKVLNKEKVSRVMPAKQPFTRNPLPEFPVQQTTAAIEAAIAKPLGPVIEDALYSEMTIRDYFAIHSGLPVSTKTWLNELVKRK